MILMLHVFIATSSLAVGGLALQRANRSLLGFQILTFVLTIVSGVILTVLHPAAWTHLCASGLIFSALSLGMIAVTRQRLAKATR